MQFLARSLHIGPQVRDNFRREFGVRVPPRNVPQRLRLRKECVECWKCLDNRKNRASLSVRDKVSKPIWRWGEKGELALQVSLKDDQPDRCGQLGNVIKYPAELLRWLCRL